MSSAGPLESDDVALFDVAADNDKPPPDPFATVVGQERAVAFLRAALTAPVHAYMLVGPRGSGKGAMSRAFAAGLLAEGAGPEHAHRAVELALTAQHPDLVVVEREGAAISVGQADEIVRRASRTPMEGNRKVLVLDEFHLVAPAAAAKLLKTIEEPPAGTFFVVLADEVTPDLVTIASRCVQVGLDSLSDVIVSEALVNEGVDPERAAAVAAFAEGDLGRARLLASDDRLAIRLASWQSIPGRLDGKGSTAIALVDEIRANIDDAEAPLRGQSSSRGRRAERPHRALRPTRFWRKPAREAPPARRATAAHRRAPARPDCARSRLPGRDGRSQRIRRARSAPSARCQRTAEALMFNPNEELLLLALLLDLPPLAPPG